jgi:hypothetical protein
MKLRQIICSVDTGVAVLITVIVWYFIPKEIKYEFTTSFYNVGISVLSIVFSLFFAALAILMAAPEDEFIEYLEKKKHFTALLFSYKYTLVCLFLSLGYSIVMYAFSDYWVKHHVENSLHSRWYFLIFVFIFTYSLTATVLCIKDAIKFSQYRLEFLRIKKSGK